MMRGRSSPTKVERRAREARRQAMSVAGAARDPVPPQRDRPTAGESPPRDGAILTVLILGAVVANINLAIANVALPSIGAALDTSQAELNLIAVGFTLGLASSVLYLGALADRYGRKPAMMLGAALSVPTSLLAAWASSGTVLIAARVSGGVAAGLLYPITLSLITGLFQGGARTRAIALWSGIGGGCSALGPLLGGLLLGRFWWGSVFLVSVPIAVLVVLLAGLWLPRHAGETNEPVDHLGGVLSVVFIGPLVLAISLVPNYGFNGTVMGLFAASLVGLVLFVLRQRRAPSPLFDLKVLRARTFTIALVGGTITWGGLLGATFIGQQYTQNVLGYSPLSAALITLPAAVFVAAAARPAGRMITTRGSRVPLALGLAVTAVGFGGMALLFGTAASAVVVGIVYGVLGIGIGLAGPPSSSSLMGSVPVARAGMGSASNDLQRDFGGALFQAVMGTLLAVEYTNYFTKAFAGLPPQQAQQLSQQAAATISQSFTGAEEVAKQFPQAQAQELIAAAQQAFVDGKTAAILFAVIASLVGLVLVLFLYPNKREEEATYARVAGRQPQPRRDARPEPEPDPGAEAAEPDAPP
jgi:DHA2 family multidrug resistance protein-like MFS transporter